MVSSAVQAIATSLQNFAPLHNSLPATKILRKSKSTLILKLFVHVNIQVMVFT